MEPTDYRVSLDVFEGPLDLLLYLVRQEEMDIYDISIHRITEQYLAYLETFELLNIQLAGEFIVMAAHLMYLKSRSLLPQHLTAAETIDDEEEDPRWDLIRQLIEYKKFKDAAQFLQQREVHRASVFSNHSSDSLPAPARPTLEGLEIFDLIQAFQRVLDRLPEEPQNGAILDDRWTVSEKITALLDTIPPGGRLRFSEFMAGARTRGEIIVSFLAILELMRTNEFRALQKDRLGDIELQRLENL